MVILDVREKEEFEAMHIPDSLLCPLSQFDLLIPGILKSLNGQSVLLMCRTGNRAKIAKNELKKYDVHQDLVSVYDGGILKWQQEGKEVRGKRSVLPIMRQVQIVASTMIFLAFLGAKFLAPEWIYLALFVGGGLALSGYTGFCPMVTLLYKLPWNKKKSKVESSNSCCSQG